MVGVVLGAMTHLVLAVCARVACRPCKPSCSGRLPLSAGPPACLMLVVWLPCFWCSQLAAGAGTRRLESGRCHRASVWACLFGSGARRTGGSAGPGHRHGGGTDRPDRLCRSGCTASGALAVASSPPHGHLMLLASLVGGLLLMAADTLARGLLAPQELPVGVLTAVLGGGYLLWLMRRRRPT
jgi:iron complex transport system permease protein